MPRLALVFRGVNENEQQRENRVIKNAGTGFSIVDLSSDPPLYFPTNYEGPLIASDPLSGRDSTEDLFGTFETQVPMMNYSILNTSFMDNLSYSDPGTTLITPGDGAAKNTRSQFAMNINAWAEPGQGAGGPEQTPDNPRDSYPKRNRNLLTFGNPYRLNEKSIESFYTAPSLAPRRLPPFVRAVNKFPFDLVDDKCVTTQEEEVASSIVLSIQARIVRLMFNSGPLLQVYPQWCSDGTLYLLSDYLLRKLEKEYSQKQLIGVIYDNFDIIEKAYSDPSRNLNRDFRFYSNRTPRENLRVLLRCVLYRVLDNIAEGTEYLSANKSIFEGDGRERFINLVRSYCERMEEYYTTEDPQPDKVQEFEGLRNKGGFGGNSTFWRAGAYLFPLAQLYAAYIISWDMTGLSTAIKELDFQLKSQAAQADDAILTAVNGSLSSRFSSLYENFPITITDYEGTPRTYYSREEASERVAYLRRGITELNREETPDFGIGDYEDLYFAAKRGGYYSLSPVDAPQEYYDTVDALLQKAATGANQEGLGYQSAWEGGPLLSIANQIKVAANLRFTNLRAEYRNRNITIALGDICTYDRDQLDNFFQESLGYSAADTVSALWDDENDQGYTGRGEEPTTSEAVSVGILKSKIYDTMQRVCALLSAPTLADAARAVGFVNEGDIQAEEDRIAINIARIQGEINILSRYI